MDPGESFSYQCTVAGLTLGVTDTFVNTTTASGTDRFEDTVTDSDDASVVTFAVLASGLVGDTVWNDLDGDGVQDAGEPGIGGATVRLTDLATGEVTTKTTDGDGKYLFAALEAGSYRTELVVSSVGGTLTTPGDFTITLAEGEARLDADFGVQDALPVTGFDLDILALVALGLLTLGAIALIATRRREAEEPGV
jgi:LPXTG-motif cell wall-anchored protein